jgi:hypothetical protein
MGRNPMAGLFLFGVPTPHLPTQLSLVVVAQHRDNADVRQLAFEPRASSDENELFPENG